MPKQLTPKQQQHLQTIVQAFEQAVTAKYTQGAQEHGGNLFDLSPERLIDEAILETIDQFVYLTTAKQKMRGEYGRSN